VRSLAFAAHLALAACASAPDEPRAIPLPTAEATGVPLSSCDCGTAPGCPPCSTPSATPIASAPLAPAAEGAFPPAAFKAPVERTAKPGDGEWTSLDVHRGAGNASPLRRSIVHPHKIRGFVVVELVAINNDARWTIRQKSLKARPSAGSARAYARGPTPNLIAVTNGGLSAGGYGVSLPAKPSSPRSAMLRQDQGRELPHRHFRRSKAPRRIPLVPPDPLFDRERRPEPDPKRKAKKWGEDGNKRSVDQRSVLKRSAHALLRDRRLRHRQWLAKGLLAAGVTVAAGLDINYSYALHHLRSLGSGSSPARRFSSDLKAPKSI
jgi:hypothetical protein